MSDKAGSNRMTDAEKQIAMRAYMDRGGTGDLRERLFAACEAVLASRAPRDVEKAAEAAYSTTSEASTTKWDFLAGWKQRQWRDAVTAAAPFLQEREAFCEHGIAQDGRNLKCSKCAAATLDRDAFLEAYAALKLACQDAWPNEPQWPALYLKRAASNIAMRHKGEGNAAS